MYREHAVCGWKALRHGLTLPRRGHVGVRRALRRRSLPKTVHDNASSPLRFVRESATQILRRVADAGGWIECCVSQKFWALDSGWEGGIGESDGA